MRIAPVLFPAVLLVALGAGLVAWIALRGESERPEAGRPVVEDPERRTAAVSAEGAMDEGFADAGFEESEEALERRTIDPTTLDPDSDTLEGPFAIVVDGPGGPPVPGAEVWFVERGDARARQRSEGGPWGLRDVELAERFGTTRRTDSAGRAPLPRPRDRLLIAARHGDRFGFVAVSNRDVLEVPVPLALDEVLHLLVLDANGDPAPDVPIGVWCADGRSEPDSLWDGRSDAEGRAQIPHFQCAGPANTGQFGAGFRFPLGDPTPVEFRGRPVPDEPVVLRMPATGTVVLSVVDRAGAPLHGAVRLALASVRAKDQQSWLPNWSDTAWTRKQPGEPEARFSPVAVGTTLRATARLEDRDSRWNGPDIIGPSYQGEVVRVALEAPEWLALITGRVTNADGSPLAWSRPAFALRIDERQIKRERLQTTDDGRFEFGFRVRDDTGPFVLDVRDDRREGPPASGQGSVPVLVPGVRFDVGDVQLTGLSAVATGRVVDDRGEPVAGAAVTLELLETSGTRERWRRDSLTRAATGEDGRYTVYAIPSGATLRARTALRGYVTAHSEAFRGIVEVPDLVLVRTAGLDATLIVPEWLPDRAISGSLFAVGTEQRVDREDIRARDGNGRLRMRGIAPGLYDLRIDLRNHPLPLLVVSGVRVDPDATEPDPRLTAINLASMLNLFEIHAVAPDGQPISDIRGAVVGRVWLPGGEQRWIGLQWRNGTARFISTHTTAEIWTLGMGRRAVQTVVPPGRTEVVLSPLQPVEVHMPGVRAAVGAERRVRVSLVLVGDTGLPTSLGGVDAWSGKSYSFERSMLGKSGGAWLGAGDRVRMDLQRNGRYRVVLRLYEPGVRGPTSRVIDTVDVVLDGPSAQVVTANVNQRAVEDAIAELRRRAER